MTSGHSSGSADRRWRRPALLPAIAAIAAILLTVSLGNWQMRRADEKRQVQQQFEAAGGEASLTLSGGPLDPPGLDGRAVRLRGRLLHEHTVFIDNRTRKGVAGFHVVTPVRIESSSLQVLVLRGWVARDPRERTRLPQLPALDGVIEFEGIAQARIPQVLELRASPAPGPDDRIWQNLDFGVFAQWSGLEMQPLLVRQTSALEDGLLRDLPVAGSDVDKHRGYAFQWYAMALATAVLWIFHTFFRRRERSAKLS